VAITIPPPPTYAQLVIPGPSGKLEDATFNPIWLSWFIELVGVVTQTTGGGGINHNLLTGIQGGAVNQFFHLSLAAYTRTLGNYTALPSVITVTASPFSYQNTSAFYDEDVIVQVGTVSSIQFTRDNVTFNDVGVIAGMFRLSPGDRLKITYSSAPTMILIPR
jgi:hypothetical protein